MMDADVDVEELRVAAHAAPRNLEDRIERLPGAAGDGLLQLRPLPHFLRGCGLCTLLFFFALLYCDGLWALPAVRSTQLQEAKRSPQASADHLTGLGLRPPGALCRTHDGLGRKVRSQTVKAGTGEVLADYVWEYNPAGEIVKEAPWHLGAVFADGRDARGRLTFQATPGNNGGSTPPPFENTIVGMPEGNQADPSLEAQGTPRKVIPVPARIAGYTLDPLGNRTFMQVDGVGTTLTYDAASRLISEISANGKSVTHEYDDWGQEIRKITVQDGFATATEAYGYDYLGRMSAYANSSTGAAWQYDYWPNGDRYAKTNLSTQWKELYVPILGQVVADYTQTGSDEIQHQASYAQGEGSKAARISSGGARAHYVVGLGGSFDLTLGDEGAVLAEAVHDSFGVSMGGDSVGPYGYAQMRSDSESGLWTSANGALYDASTGRIFDSGDDYAAWTVAEAEKSRMAAIETIEDQINALQDSPLYRLTLGIYGNSDFQTYHDAKIRLRGNDALAKAKAAYRNTMSGVTGMAVTMAAEVSLVNPIARIVAGRSVTDPTPVETIDRWNEGALVAATLGLAAWSNALRAELSAPRAISLQVEGAAELARNERALAMHARAHAAARAEMRVAAQAERYASPGMFRGEAARLQAKSAARHGFTDATAATRSAVGMAQTATHGTINPNPSGRLVIGKLDDLMAPGAIRPNETTLLPRLPNLGSAKANLRQNLSILRSVMREGYPIRDATVNWFTGRLERNTGFLRAERMLFENRGWTYNPKTTLWMPPKP